MGHPRHGKTRSLRRAFLALAILVAAASPLSAQTEPVYLANRIPSNGVRISYELTIEQPSRNIYRVEIQADGIREDVVRLALPAWSPGAYRIVDYARNVQAFTAHASDSLRSLDWQKIDKQTWEIRKSPEDDIRVSYEVFSEALTPDMADLAGPATYMFVEGHTHVPVTLRYHVPPSWEVFTGLTGEEGIFAAPDYDVLIDAPAFIGRPRVLEFLYEGERYRLVFSDPGIRFDEDDLVADIRAIVDATVDIFGSTPFEHYTFLFRVNPGPGSGGLEHLNSTRITVGRNDLTNRERYERFLYVVAHEFFHVWNVKWIRPEVLGPFDYSREVHTRLLWVSEGVTSYYGRLLLRRAGLLSQSEYLESLSRQIGSFQQSPGRFLMSNEEASWNTWLTSDNASNNTISYYTKGEIAGLLLDLEIRARTQGQRTLDDVMRHMMENWAARGAGIPEDGFLTSLEAVGGTEFDAVYQELARDRGEPDYDRYLAHAGLELRSDRGAGSLYMGVTIEPAALDRPRVVSIVPDSPAEAAGLTRGDVILSVEGRPVTMETLTEELNRHSFGDTVEVAFRRGDRELAVDLTPVENPLERWTLEELPRADASASTIRNAWLQGAGEP
jgi:predicted metalloprotease with PDZ domain